MGRQTDSQVPARRPRNRKSLITEAAAPLFHRDGYHNVSVDDVAAAAGITGSALYRHFPNKNALLAHIVGHELTLAETTVSDAVHHIADPREALDTTLRALAQLTLNRRHIGTLWQRETRHLSARAQADFARQFLRLVRRLATMRTHCTPPVADTDSELLVLASLAVLASPSFHELTLPKGGFERTLSALAEATMFGDVEPDGPPTDPRAEPHRDGDPPMEVHIPRRELLINTAARMFQRSGYPSVSMEDIGRAAGISGPGVYHHFSTKAELLAAVLTKAAAWLQFRFEDSIRSPTSSAHTLSSVLNSYTEHCLRNGELVIALIHEAIHLPPATQHLLQQAWDEHAIQWAGLLRQMRPELNERTALLRVHAALALTNQLTQVPRLRFRPNLQAELVSLSRGLLLLPA